MPSTALPPFSILAPPYQELLPVDPAEGFPSKPEVRRGVALVWSADKGIPDAELMVATDRPPGVPLIVILPGLGPARRDARKILQLVEEARPQALLPSAPVPDPHELVHLLRAEPDTLAAELLDYLAWRGLHLDRETQRIVRRIVELSTEVRTLTAAAKGVYLSRRALGRRFRERGLPVPSHWLQFSRILRAALKLQNHTRLSLHEVARALGYPDGFTLSNQMDRLLGVRPSVVRERLGWEWIVEAWLEREAESGGLTALVRGASLARHAGSVKAHTAAPAIGSVRGKALETVSRVVRSSRAKRKGVAV